MRYAIGDHQYKLIQQQNAREAAAERKRLEAHPLVSIVTNTWQRSDTLFKRLIPAIQKQTYPIDSIEHVIVSDGIDDKLSDMLDDLYPYNLEVYQLGRNSSSMLTDSYGVVPLQVGCWLARGKYIICIPDDDIMDPTHIEECVKFLEEEPNLGFVYTGFIHRTANSVHIVQGPEPRAGVIASPMFRAELLAISTWQTGEGLQADYKLVQRWLDAGVEYGFIDTPTFEHFADH